MTRITEAAKIEKIVDYYFEKNEKSNVLAIHPSQTLIAYLITIQRTQKVSKAWSPGGESLQSPSSSINGQHNTSSINTSLSNNADKNRTVSIRIIDYNNRQRCLAKGVYHARPADCAFTVNSIICSQANIIKMAVVDRLANIYLYDISYFINELTATRIAVIRAPGELVSPYESISIVWCPFVPCEDFDDGDCGLRLALSANTKIEIFAIDRLQGRTGELLRSELKGAYKCIKDAHKTDIVSMSISPDCSTMSAAALDNKVTFFSSDIEDCGQLCLHNWEVNITDNSSISKLFYLDDYPKLLEDSTMKFWGSVFIGTKKGQMHLVDLKTWTSYQIKELSSTFSDWPPGRPNFNYQIEMTSRNIVAMWETVCFVIQLALNADGMSEIVKVTRLALPNPIYSFVIKRHSETELELFTISAYSLERYTINLNALSCGEETPSIQASMPEETRPNANTPHELKRFLQQFDGSLRISSSSNAPNNTPNNSDINIFNTSAIETTPIKQQDMDVFNLMNSSMAAHSANKRTNNSSAPVLAPTQIQNVGAILNNNSLNSANNNNLSMPKSDATTSMDVVQMDRMVEALFTKLNTAFSQGLDEFLNDVKCEVNDLKLKLNGLCRDVRKLQQQLHETRPK